MAYAKNIEGQRFHRLTALAHVVTRRGLAFWRCRCDCGAEVVVAGSKLRNGHTRSCGCLRRDNPTHGHARKGKRSLTYRVWQSMIVRCTKPSHAQYARYGGRGIAVCERWLASFEAFLADMGECPPGLTLDRRDNDKGYEAGNCRWATRMEQARNTVRNVRVAFRDGFYTIADVARMTGVNDETLRWRLKHGKPLLRAGEHISAQQT